VGGVTGPPVESAGFAGLLRALRHEAGLTQEELAEAAGLSVRGVAYLERGAVSSPQRETVRLLADALHLAGPGRAEFEATARGRPVPGGVAAATRTLPRDVGSFTGRERELEVLARAAAGAGQVVGIHAIGGMAGVGKTAFAVHAAHRLAGQFPAGQIFLPLHGHTPGQQPVDPADALASLLLTAGVPPAQIPPDLEARTALWRDRLAGQQLLLILDDAVGSEQVLPLLPGTAGSVVLVTSRRHLSGLDDATAISLDTMPAAEAAGLLVRLAGRADLAADDPGVREITRLCGYLPLAIGMVARQLRHHPAWTAAGRADDLAAAVDRLDLMATENMSVAAAFNLSYADLDLDLQRLFRRLGLHPGTEADAYAAAALDGTPLADARRGLEGLYDQYLLTEPVQGRYRMHDLIGEHARALADRVDTDRNRHQATAGLLDYYQYTAARANALIARQTRPGRAAPDGAIPAAVPDLTDSEQALAWARAERATLLACLDDATSSGQHARVVALTAGLAGLLQHDGPWGEAITRHQAAVEAALHLGDRLAEASALHDLGIVQRQKGDYPAAVRDLERALDIYSGLGDRLGQANALLDLGLVRRTTGDYPAAAQALDQASGIYRDLGDRPGQANALSGLGALRRRTGAYPAATRDLEEALGIYRDLGDRPGQASVLSILGALRLLTGEYRAAILDLEQALDIHRDLGNRLGQANALLYRGTVRRRTGEFPAATRDLEEALGISRDLGNRLGQANALSILGDVRRLTGEYPAAAQDLEQALGIYRDLGDRPGQANALVLLGAVRRMTAEYPAATEDLEKALDVFRALGDRGGEAVALNEAGTLYRITGELARAEKHYRQALDLGRQIGSPRDEAHALAGLGHCALAAGHPAQGQALLGQAMDIFQKIGAPEADDISRELTTHAPDGEPTGVWVPRSAE
jgi:tetratricopeptide (TPR) repeat protein/transcriptional regulator with XRE-family HTH domain